MPENLIDAPRAPYTGLLETNPGQRLQAAADLHRPHHLANKVDWCTTCSTTWPCRTADALSGGVYLAKPKLVEG